VDLQLFSINQLVFLCELKLLKEKLESVFLLQHTNLKLFELSRVFNNDVAVHIFNLYDYLYLLLDAYDILKQIQEPDLRLRIFNETAPCECDQDKILLLLDIFDDA